MSEASRKARRFNDVASCPHPRSAARRRTWSRASVEVVVRGLTAAAPLELAIKIAGAWCRMCGSGEHRREQRNRERTDAAFICAW